MATLKDSDLRSIGVACARANYCDFLDLVGEDESGVPITTRPLDRLTWQFVEECHEANVPAGVMLPMGFGKTTQFCYRAAWEIGRNPSTLVTIVTDEVGNSCDRLGLIRRILDTEKYRLVFPKVAIVRGRDSRESFTVHREGLSKDPTCRAEGVTTGTGVRTNFLLMDDVITLRNALLNPADRKRVLEAIRTTWMSRARLGVKTKIAWIQTAYHLEDAARVLREVDRHSGWRWLVVRAEPPYEALSWERWQDATVVATGAVESPYAPEALVARAQQMGPTAAARGLGNRPIAGENCPFHVEHFRGPPPMPEWTDYVHRLLVADPAGDATRAKHGDPDYCGVVVLGQLPNGYWDVLAADHMRGAPLDQARLIAATARRWHVDAVYQEAVKDEALCLVTRQELERIKYPMPVIPEKPTTNKEIRVTQILEPTLSLQPQRLRVCGEMFPELVTEALSFPAGVHDDLIDALATAWSKARGKLWTRPVAAEPRRRTEDDTRDPDRDRPKSPWDGYGARMRL